MEFLFIALQAIQAVVFVDAIASWFVAPDSFPRSVTTPLVEPLYRPIRAVLDPARMGGLDLSPLVVILSLQVVARVLAQALV